MANKGKDKGEAEKLVKDMEKLNEYVQQMAYKPIKPPLASEHTESLARTRKRNIVGTYDEHKDDLSPNERSNRVGRIVANHKAISTGQLEDIIRQYRKKQAKSQRDKKESQILYHETLMKLQRQAEEQFMNAIIHKFAKKIAKRASNLSPPDVETESYKLLQDSLVCNMLFALKVPNAEQPQDYTLYVKLSRVLADLIMQAIFRAQNKDNSFNCSMKPMGVADQLQKKNNDRCIHLRAIRAAKKVCCRRQRNLKTRCSFFSF